MCEKRYQKNWLNVKLGAFIHFWWDRSVVTSILLKKIILGHVICYVRAVSQSAIPYYGSSVILFLAVMSHVIFEVMGLEHRERNQSQT